MKRLAFLLLVTAAVVAACGDGGSMGEQARAALAPFRVEQVLARLESFYRELLGTAARAS